MMPAVPGILIVALGMSGASFVTQQATRTPWRTHACRLHLWWDDASLGPWSESRKKGFSENNDVLQDAFQPADESHREYSRKRAYSFNSEGIHYVLSPS
jgi:hypothetical protein